MISCWNLRLIIYIYIPEGCNPVPIWLIHKWRRLESCHNPVGPARSATVVRCNCLILGWWSGEKYWLIMVNGILMVHNGIWMGYSSNIVTCYPGWWFGKVWNHGILWLSIGWEFHHPNWRSHIFQRGRYTTNQYLILSLFWVFPHPSPSFMKQGQNSLEIDTKHAFPTPNQSTMVYQIIPDWHQ